MSVLRLFCSLTRILNLSSVNIHPLDDKQSFASKTERGVWFIDGASQRQEKSILQSCSIACLSSQKSANIPLYFFCFKRKIFVFMCLLKNLSFIWLVFFWNRRIQNERLAFFKVSLFVECCLPLLFRLFFDDEIYYQKCRNNDYRQCVRHIGIIAKSAKFSI